MTPELALSLSIASGLDDDEVVDKRAWVEEQLKAYRDTVGKRTVAVLKGEMNMTLHDESILAIAKGVVDRGAPAVFDKSVYIAAIAKRAADLRAPGESEAQAFTKAITQDEIGRTLYKASKVAPGREVEGDASQDFVPRTPTDVIRGPAHAKMQALADDHLRAHPELAERRGVKDGGKAAAYAAAYAHPNNHDLRQRVKAEHLAALSRMVA